MRKCYLYAKTCLKPTVLTKADGELIKALARYHNTVVHVINGVVAVEELRKLYDHNLKILILGYKDFRRGIQAHSKETDQRMATMYDELPHMLDRFAVVSFDNLAIRQLDVKRLLSAEEWNKFYMGDDGKFTMYVDLVKREFAKSSTSEKRHPITENIAEMFETIRGEA